MDQLTVKNADWPAPHEAIKFWVNDQDLSRLLLPRLPNEVALPLQLISTERTVCSVFQGIADERLSVLANYPEWGGWYYLTARVQWREHSVIWSEFATDFGLAKFLSPQVGPFEFAREQYENIMNHCRELAAVKAA